MISNINFPSPVAQFTLVAGVGFLGGSIVKMILPYASISPGGAAFFGITALAITHIAKYTMDIELAACLGGVIGYVFTVNHGYNLSIIPLTLSYTLGAFALIILSNIIKAN